MITWLKHISLTLWMCNKKRRGKVS